VLGPLLLQCLLQLPCHFVASVIATAVDCFPTQFCDGHTDVLRDTNDFLCRGILSKDSGSLTASVCCELSSSASFAAMVRVGQSIGMVVCLAPLMITVGSKILVHFESNNDGNNSGIQCNLGVST